MAEIDLRDQNNVIRDMLPHKPMRLSMENKNLLSEKGDIYVGTGKSQTVNIEDDTYIIAETAKVSVPPEVISSNESAILIYDKTNNLQYKKSSESGFVTYTVDQTGTIVDPPGQGTGPKTRLLTNIFDNLTNAQKDYVRLQIGAGAAQGIAGIAAGNGIKVDSNTPSSPKVSVNLAQNSGMEFYSNQLKLKIGDGISVADGAISVNLAENSGLVFDDGFQPAKLKLNVSSSSQSGDEDKYWVKIDGNNHPYVNVSVPSYTGSDGISVSNGAISVNLAQNSGLVFDDGFQPAKLKLDVVSRSQDGNKYWVQIDNYNHPYVNVEVPSSDNQTIAYAPNTSPASGITAFGNNATVKLVPGNNIGMDVDTSNNYIQINATYTGGKGISVSNETISLAKGYDVPIEYQASASSTADFAPNKLYLIGTWTGV